MKRDHSSKRFYRYIHFWLIYLFLSSVFSTLYEKSLMANAELKMTEMFIPRSTRPPPRAPHPHPHPHPRARTPPLQDQQKHL